MRARADKMIAGGWGVRRVRILLQVLGMLGPAACLMLAVSPAVAGSAEVASSLITVSGHPPGASRHGGRVRALIAPTSTHLAQPAECFAVRSSSIAAPALPVPVWIQSSRQLPSSRVTVAASCLAALLAGLRRQVGLGFSALTLGGVSVSHLDIAPRNAGVIFGAGNTTATLAGLLSVPFTGFLLQVRSLARCLRGACMALARRGERGRGRREGGAGAEGGGSGGGVGTAGQPRRRRVRPGRRGASRRATSDPVDGVVWCLAARNRNPQATGSWSLVFGVTAAHYVVGSVLWAMWVGDRVLPEDEDPTLERITA